MFIHIDLTSEREVMSYFIDVYTSHFAATTGQTKDTLVIDMCLFKAE